MNNNNNNNNSRLIFLWCTNSLHVSRCKWNCPFRVTCKWNVLIKCAPLLLHNVPFLENMPPSDSDISTFVGRTVMRCSYKTTSWLIHHCLSFWECFFFFPQSYHGAYLTAPADKLSFDFFSSKTCYQTSWYVSAWKGNCQSEFAAL